MMELTFLIDSRLHGKGEVIFSWHPDGLYIASTGTSRVVQISDRKGELIHQIVPPSPSICTALEWNWDGSILAVLQANSSVVVLWDVVSHESRHLDLHFRDPTCFCWSKTLSRIFVAGTTKGNVLFYNDATQERYVSKVKLKKKVVMVDWNSDEQVAIVSEDRQLTLAMADSQLPLDQVRIKARPLDVKFGGTTILHQKIVSVNLDARSIWLYNIQEREAPLELLFPQWYGNIIAYQWYGNGYVIAGFSSGYVAAVSAHADELGQEQYGHQVLLADLRSMSYCETTDMVAACTSNAIKVVRLVDGEVITEVDLEDLEKDADILSHVRWKAGGEILNASTASGSLYNLSVRSLTKSSKFRQTESLRVAFLRPMSILEISMTFVAVLATVIALSAFTLDVHVVHLLEAILGISDTI